MIIKIIIISAIIVTKMAITLAIIVIIYACWPTPFFLLMLSIIIITLISTITIIVITVIIIDNILCVTDLTILPLEGVNLCAIIVADQFFCYVKRESQLSIKTCKPSSSHINISNALMFITGTMRICKPTIKISIYCCK